MVGAWEVPVRRAAGVSGGRAEEVVVARGGGGEGYI